MHIAFPDNFPPKIEIQSNVINATLYKTVELNITAVDNDTITFRVINKPAGAIENQSGHKLYLTWNVTSSQKVSYKLSSAVDIEHNIIRVWHEKNIFSAQKELKTATLLSVV